MSVIQTRSKAVRRQPVSAGPKPSQQEVEDAFRLVLRWIGEDTYRDGLKETPVRLVRAFGEYFSGYSQNPAQMLHKTFEEVDGYDEMIVLRGIPFESHCEHHVAPIIRTRLGRLCSGPARRRNFQASSCR